MRPRLGLIATTTTRTYDNNNNNNNNINKNNYAWLCAKNFQLQGGRSIAVTTIEVASVIN